MFNCLTGHPKDYRPIPTSETDGENAKKETNAAGKTNAVDKDKHHYLETMDNDDEEPLDKEALNNMK